MTAILKTVSAWKKWIQKQSPSASLGFVPTMGNLHAGHQSLMQRSKQENNLTVVSLFVNPTQFNNPDDFKHYPRTFDEDLKQLQTLHVDALFAPEYDDLYPDQNRYRVHETEFSRCMEGVHRPGHFDGMLTVVLKLLQIIQADRAYFGEKDHQQLKLVEGLVQAFFIDTKIVACPTVRNTQGLALSSRNSRLSPETLQKALYFPWLLKSTPSPQAIREQLEAEGFTVDYIEDHKGRRFGAVWLEGVRLIDNIVIQEF